MVKQVLLSAALALSCIAGVDQTAAHATNFTADEVQPKSDRAVLALLDEIVGWLSRNFDLRASGDLPRVELVAPAQIAALRYSGMMPLQPGAGGSERSSGADAVIAVYHDAKRTIYLSEGWTGTSPAEQSVLVHEVVHHLQNVGRQAYRCPQEREKLAYAAQQRWLGQTGSSLEKEFEIDPFTLLAMINCLM